MRFTVCSLGAAIYGLCSYLVQSYMQAQTTLPAFIKGFAGLWYYRSGIADIIFYKWIIAQINFLMNNFFVPLAVAGIIGLFFGFKNKFRTHDQSVRIGTIFIT